MRYDEMKWIRVTLMQTQPTSATLCACACVCMCSKYVCIYIFSPILLSVVFLFCNAEQADDLMFGAIKEHDERERKLDSCTIEMINWMMGFCNNNKLTRIERNDIDRIMVSKISLTLEWVETSASHTHTHTRGRRSDCAY